MELSEVPESKLVVASADPVALADALRSIAAKNKWMGFGAMAIIHGAPRTGRFFMMFQKWGAVRFQHWLVPYLAVVEMMRLMRQSEVRYDPLENPGMVQGWEIWEAMVDGQFGAIVWASWVPRS
jgi:hypothetical protein